MSNEARIRRMMPRDRYEVELDRYYNRESVRLSSDFSDRNKALYAASKEVGEMNRHEGAAHLIAMGRGANMRGYRDVSHAESLSSKSSLKAIELGRKACDACPLSDFCAIDSQMLINRISEDAVLRKRFAGRVKKPDNDHLCETNLSGSRLKK